MRTGKLIILVGLSLMILTTGCTYILSPIFSIFDGVYPVWTELSPPGKEVPPPEGFIITPSEAYGIAYKEQILKIAWVIYADKEYYYVLETAARGHNSYLAKTWGVKINGKTGEIVQKNK